VLLPFDLDIAVYVWSTFRILFASKSRLRQNTRPIPVRYELQIISEDQLTPAQREYLEPIDSQLASIGYSPTCTYCVRNHGTNMVRRYDHPSDPATCTVTIIEVKIKVESVRGVKNACSATFTTRLDGGRRFVTRNMAQKSLFDRPDYLIEQRLPNVTNLAQLKKKHDEHARNLGPVEPPVRDVEGILREAESEHERYSKYQLEQGVYEMSADGTGYVMTDKVFNRGIRNHFLPFGKRLSLPQVLFSGLLGAVLPLFGILRLAPWVRENAGLDATGQSLVAGVAIAACYVLAGAIIGWLCDVQKFTWVMLVSYIPPHLVAGWTYGWFPYATLLFTTCYLVAQARRKRALILQT
jgi:hypothetical protein